MAKKEISKISFVRFVISSSPNLQTGMVVRRVDILSKNTKGYQLDKEDLKDLAADSLVQKQNLGRIMPGIYKDNNTHIARQGFCLVEDEAAFRKDIFTQTLNVFREEDKQLMNTRKALEQYCKDAGINLKDN